MGVRVCVRACVRVQLFADNTGAVATVFDGACSALP